MDSKWLKYDLHMHSHFSKIMKDGDSDKVKEMSAKEYVDILLKENIDVFSITDHNYFSSEYYDEIETYIADYNIKVIYGVELDVYVDLNNGEKDFFQVNVYFAPTASKVEIKDTVAELYKDGNKPTINDIIYEIGKLNVKFIIIPEGNKARGIVNHYNDYFDNDRELFNRCAMHKVFAAHDLGKGFKQEINEKWALNFYKSTYNYNQYIKDKTPSEIENIDKQLYEVIFKGEQLEIPEINKIIDDIKNYGNNFAYFSFSDWHNATEYSSCWSNNNYIFGSLEDYFDTFEIAAIDPESRVYVTKESLSINDDNIKEIEFLINEKVKRIEFTPGLNVIIGKRGSGKSLLMAVIEELKAESNGELSKYSKSFKVENIKAKTYDGIELKPGMIRSITVLKQEEITKIFENPEETPNEIKLKFKKISNYDKVKLENLQKLANNIEKYSNDYSSVTTYLKQIKKINNYSFEKKYLDIDLNTIELIPNQLERLVSTFQDEVSKLKISVGNIEKNKKHLVFEMKEIIFKLKLYEELYSNKNDYIDEFVAESSKEASGVTTARNELAKIYATLKENLSKKLQFLKLKYYINQTDFSIPNIGVSKVGKYLLITSYRISEDIKEIIRDSLVEGINKQGKKYSSQMELIEDYVKGERILKSNTRLTDSLSNFIDGEAFTKESKFYEIINLEKIEISNLNKGSDIKNAENKGWIKDLSNESPGTKSTALLEMLFHLDNNIILLDQPEDNIDNKYISEDLVPTIKKIKAKKQLIFVTHNPSIAVYADAFNYIYSTNEKGIINYTNHIIEKIEDKEEILTILDGGRPSFSVRNNKYGNVIGVMKDDI